MSETKKQNKNTKLEETEQALRATLRESGDLFPRTVADIEQIESEIDIEKVRSPDLNKFRTAVRNRTAVRIPRLPAQDPDLEEQVVQDLRAARHGKDIPQRVLERMHADRKASENKLKK